MDLEETYRFLTAGRPALNIYPEVAMATKADKIC